MKRDHLAVPLRDSAENEHSQTVREFRPVLQGVSCSGALDEEAVAHEVAEDGQRLGVVRAERSNLLEQRRDGDSRQSRCQDRGELFGDRSLRMRDGRVEQDGPPQDLIERPANDFVRRFVESQRSPVISKAER